MPAEGFIISSIGTIYEAATGERTVRW